MILHSDSRDLGKIWMIFSHLFCLDNFLHNISLRGLQNLSINNDVFQFQNMQSIHCYLC